MNTSLGVIDGVPLNQEFARLAAARRIVSVRATTGSLVDDRHNAERWIARFGSSMAHCASLVHIRRHENSIVASPIDDAAAAVKVFYIHGGGLVYYSTATFAPFLGIFAHELSASVEAFDYLKAPENSMERSMEALATAMSRRLDELDGEPIVLAGDSVGGLIVLYLALRVFPNVFSRIVLAYPVLDLCSERRSYVDFSDGYFLDRNAMRRFRGVLEPFFADRGFDPFDLSVEDVQHVPSPLLVTCGYDVLRDEGLDWGSYMEGRGVRMESVHFADLPHDFYLYAGNVASARRAVAVVAGSVFHR